MGSKVCSCHENGIYNCKYDRKYSDIDATWGWDSDLNTWFYGHTLYALSTYDPVAKSDLPLLFRYTQAKRHDSISGIVALAELGKVSLELPISNSCFDSANDNYPTYQLLKEWDINPFIDLNGNRGKTATLPKTLRITDKGVPICIGDNEMIYDGFCAKVVHAINGLAR